MRQSLIQTAEARLRRRAMSDPERLLWQHLRGRRLMGLKFRRQVPLGPFFAAFYCASGRLAVDVDARAGEAGLDWMRRNGFRVLHIRSSEIAAGLPGVLARIARMAGAPR